MYLVHADDIQLTAETRILLSHVSFSIMPKEHIGIVGKNGTGKTTLLKALANRTKPRKGDIDVRCTTFYVPQDLLLTDEYKSLPVISYALTLHDEGWNVFHLIEELFDYRGITPEKLMGQLSGGELTMLHLALGLLIEPELLLLDEPTNHLDLYGTEKLIGALRNYRKALVIVSHDSYLLDNAVDKIWELRSLNLHKYTGNYTSFSEQKSHEYALLTKKLREETQELREAKARKQEVAERTMRREADAKKLRNKGIPRIIQGTLIEQAAKSTSHAMSLARKSERDILVHMQETKAKLKQNQTLNIGLGQGSESVFSLVDIYKGTLTIKTADTQKPLLLVSDITLRLTNKDKALLMGRNGTGKSSLLKAIQGEPHYEIAAETKPILPTNTVYIDQHYSFLHREKTVMSHLAELLPNASYEELRKILGNFLFMTDDQVNQLAGTLSGGEKARLALAIASVSERTLLMLDEPTNNLDVESVDKLVRALQSYSGGILLVSHDIGFIQKLDLTMCYEITDKRLFAVS